MVLLSFWTHAPHLTGRISHSDHEANTLFRPRIDLMYVLYSRWMGNDGARHEAMVHPGSRLVLGYGGAYRTHDLVQNSATSDL